MIDYIAAMNARVAAQAAREAENAAEADAAKTKALDGARRYVAGMVMVDTDDAFDNN